MKVVKSNLKKVLSDKGLSIRQLSKETGLKFETLRRMYNDDTKHYNKEMIAIVCDTLNIGINDLLILENKNQHI